MNFKEVPENPLPELDKQLRHFFDYNSVIAPVIFNCKERKQSVLVHIDPQDLIATLYYRPQTNYDNGKTVSYKSFIGVISECVLNLLEYSAKLAGLQFEEDHIQGRIVEVHEAHTEEDMLIFAC